ncbi:class I SAM-dependent methyltransferase [Permianibacter fluminis]|uniref:class I SAM-dependent methyltransferase n=1 Tax=Permianibacter fluminis TaxID=2738515 RepID=UPI002E28B03E|nr:class I SAM-dependent methyltransferase [Permianibacter fluminis]
MDGRIAFVEETRFGVWFLGTETWRVHVLQRALNDLQQLLGPVPAVGSVLDIGFGHGKALLELAKRFQPEQLVGIDADPAAKTRAEQTLASAGVLAELHTCNAAATRLPDNSFDIVFCHQTLHHIVAQETALAEIFRVLKPGGKLLLAESTKKYIHSLPIRILFRHPMHVQKTAEEYLALVRAAGFTVQPEQISYPYLWWSRSDIGFFEWLGFKPRPNHEETLINLVAVKPG